LLIATVMSYYYFTCISQLFTFPITNLCLISKNSLFFA